MQYFKVVRETDDENVYNSSFVKGAACLEYEVGKLTKAPEWLASNGYGVTVFSNLALAVEYRRVLGSHPVKIFQVAIMGTPKAPPTYLSNIDLQRGRISLRPNAIWPEGTLMVDGCILMEEIFVL